jgi:hypothetical protein
VACSRQFASLQGGDQDRTVGILTYYWLDSPGFKSWHGQMGKWFSLPQNHPDQLWGLPSLLFSWYRDSFLVVKWLGREVDRWPHLVLRLRMSGALLFLPLCAFMAWTGITLLFNLLYDLANNVKFMPTNKQVRSSAMLRGCLQDISALMICQDSDYHDRCFYGLSQLL